MFYSASNAVGNSRFQSALGVSLAAVAQIAGVGWLHSPDASVTLRNGANPSPELLNVLFRKCLYAKEKPPQCEAFLLELGARAF